MHQLFLRPWVRCVLAGVLWLPVQAAAKPGPASASASEAESVAETAARRFKEGEFELAAQLFDRAWSMAKRPALLFNAARAWERAGKPEMAIERFEAYLQVATDPGGIEEARLRAAKLRAELAKVPAGSAAEPSKSVPSNGSGAPDAVGNPVADAGPAASTPVASTPQTPAERGLNGPVAVQAPALAAPSHVGQWLLFGVGAATALTGGVILGLAIRDDGNLENKVDIRNDQGWVTGISQHAAFEQVAASESRRTWGASLAIAGGVGVAAALGWLALEGPHASALYLAPAGQGLALGGSF